MQTGTLALTLALAALPAAASSIVPPSPLAFEQVNLRMNVDGCAFVPGTVQVNAAGGTIKVTHQPNQCFAPGPAQVIDVGLGSLPPGTYRVEVFASSSTDGPPAESLAFQVLSPLVVATFPPQAHPITDHTGLWWNPAQSGWGLNLVQSPLYTLFGTLFVYGTDNEAEWFTLQGGRWETATRWTGTVYRTRGPAYTSPSFDPLQVTIEPVGAATLEFSREPGSEGTAQFTYQVGNTAYARVIQRML